MERSREITTLPLAPVYKTRLHTAGYRNVGDLTNLCADYLSKDIGLSISDCETILQIIETCKTCIPKSRTALQVLAQEESTVAIITFSEKLDAALGGGIHTGMLTEICGEPGVGKTQLCLQLSCDVQIPGVFGGLNAEVIYIDTEGGFIVDRVTDLVSATVRHCQFIASRESDSDVLEAVSGMTVEKLLAGIHVYCCHDNSQLLAVVNLLPGLLKQNRKVKLVVIDSVAFHFRHDFEDLSLRTRILTNLAQTLIRIYRELDISVVVTNQMTTRVHHGSDKGSHLVPCLGESWGHACTTRIILQFENESRQAWLYKSPNCPQTKVPFQITADGIRDTVDQTKPHNISLTETESGSSFENPSKRQKLS